MRRFMKGLVSFLRSSKDSETTKSLRTDKSFSVLCVFCVIDSLSATGRRQYCRAQSFWWSVAAASIYKKSRLVLLSQKRGGGGRQYRLQQEASLFYWCVVFADAVLTTVSPRWLSKRVERPQSTTSWSSIVCAQRQLLLILRFTKKKSNCRSGRSGHVSPDRDEVMQLAVQPILLFISYFCKNMLGSLYTDGANLALEFCGRGHHRSTKSGASLPPRNLQTAKLVLAPQPFPFYFW